MDTLRRAMLSIKCWWSGHDEEVLERLDHSWAQHSVYSTRTLCRRCGDMSWDYSYD